MRTKIITVLILIFYGTLITKDNSLDESLYLKKFESLTALKIGLSISNFISNYRSKEITEDEFPDIMNFNLNDPQVRKEYQNASNQEKKQLDEFLKTFKTFRMFKISDLPKGVVFIRLIFVEQKAVSIQLTLKKPYGEILTDLIRIYGLPTSSSGFPNFSDDKLVTFEKDKGASTALNLITETTVWEGTKKSILAKLTTNGLDGLSYKTEVYFNDQGLKKIFKALEK